MTLISLCVCLYLISRPLPQARDRGEGGADSGGTAGVCVAQGTTAAVPYDSMETRARLCIGGIQCSKLR